MLKFERDLTFGSKVMAILTRYAGLADQTSSSMSSDSIATLMKTASENSCKISARSNRMIKSYCHFDPSFKSGRRDLLIIELRFYINPKENDLRKLVQKF